MTQRFLKGTPVDKCANCGAYAPSLSFLNAANHILSFAVSVKKDNISTKLFMVKLSETRRSKMWKSGVRYPYPLPINGAHNFACIFFPANR